MDLNLDRNDGVLVIGVAGRLDAGDAMNFEGTVRSGIEDADRAVVMDMGELRYISSAGLRAVLLVAKNLKKSNTAFVVCSLPDNIGDVFRMSGMDKIIEVQESKAAALASLND